MKQIPSNLLPAYQRRRSAPALPRYRENDLFRTGPRFQLNACVGRNGGPYDLHAYSRGYFLAGQRLSASLSDNTMSVDVLVYPLVFLYRHGVELGLKALAQKLPRIWEDDSRIHLTHKLQDNWARVRPYLTREPEFDPNEPVLAFVDRVLADFVEIDPTGEAFRFPAARSGNLFLQDRSVINVEVIGKAMTTVADAFDYGRIGVSPEILISPSSHRDPLHPDPLPRVRVRPGSDLWRARRATRPTCSSRGGWSDRAGSTVFRGLSRRYMYRQQDPSPSAQPGSFQAPAQATISSARLVCRPRRLTKRTELRTIQV